MHHDMCRNMDAVWLVPYSMACCAWKLGPGVSFWTSRTLQERGKNSRSLLSSETLEDDLGIAVDAQVVDGLRVGRRAVGAAGDAAQRRGASGGSGDGLHDGCSEEEGLEEQRRLQDQDRILKLKGAAWSGGFVGPEELASEAEGKTSMTPRSFGRFVPRLSRAKPYRKGMPWKSPALRKVTENVVPRVGSAGTIVPTVAAWRFWRGAGTCCSCLPVSATPRRQRATQRTTQRTILEGRYVLEGF